MLAYLNHRTNLGFARSRCRRAAASLLRFSTNRIAAERSNSATISSPSFAHDRGITIAAAACVLFSLALHQSRAASNRHCQDSLKSTVLFSGRSLPDGSGLESDMRFCSALSWAEAGFCIGLFAVQALARADDDPNRAQFLASCGTCHSVGRGRRAGATNNKRECWRAGGGGGRGFKIFRARESPPTGFGTRR